MKIPSSLRWQPTGHTLGRGGQAAVVEVEDSSNEFQGTFALKALSRGKPQKAYERFAREIDALKVVAHPFIIRVVDHSTDNDDFHYYVMESHEGAVSLKKLIGSDNNPFKSNAILSLSLFIKIISAIRACEEKDIVHRDLSPANILILPDQSIKIIDFGICQHSDNETITLADEGVGTQNYMAPETESGSTESITSQADLYSAGKILWSAITNQNAFAREGSVFTSKTMSRLFPNDPAAWHLHHVFEKTIRHNRKDRWRTTEEALVQARHVDFLIASGYPPLELILEKCPLCGVGKLGSFDQPHMVFGNPNPPGISSLQCDFCGICFAHNWKLVKENLQQRTVLT